MTYVDSLKPHDAPVKMSDSMPLAPAPPLNDTAPADEPRPRRRRPWLVVFKLFVVALLIWGIHRTVGRAIEDLSDIGWSPAQLDIAGLLVAAVLYLLGLFPAGVFWWQIMRRLGQYPGVLETLRAYYIGHLGKYVPGKALVVILRTSLVRSPRTDTGIAAAAVFCETLTMMAVGAFVGGAVVLGLFRDQFWLAALAVGLMFAAGVPTVPPVFVRLARLAGVGKKSPEVVERLANLDYPTLGAGWGLNLLGWLFVGTSLWLTVQAAGFANPDRVSHEWIVCTGAAALAVVAGFASLIPGGFGVRDAVLLVLLVPTFGQAGALVATVVARLVWLVAEVVISIILYLAKRRD